MKKILYLLCMMLTVMSCNENTDYEADNTHGQNPDGTYTLSLTLEDPGKTKAPVTMARYVLEMYEKDLSATPVRATSSTGTFDVNLKRGVDYICLFWADDNTCYNADNLKAVSQKAENTSGTPAYAAVKTINTTNFNGAVTLKRAVAEVNFIEKEGCTDVDNNLRITYPYASATLNIADGTVTRTAGTTLRVIKGAVSPAAGATLASDYVLASTAKESLSGVKLQLNSYPEKTLNSTAIQANYKTQVIGIYAGGNPANITMTVNGVKFDFTLVKAGTFQMGMIAGDPVLDATRDVLTWVKITKDYYIGTTEVTQEQWKAIMGNNPSAFKVPIAPDYDTDKYPVESISWLNICGGTHNTTTVPDADCFLTKIKTLTNKNFRLPTNAEWEYAARGGQNITTRMRYPGTNDFATLVEFSWYVGNSNTKTHKVAGKLSNPLGLYDMGGNVSEFTSNYSEWNRAVGTEAAPILDPQGPATGTTRMVCGGNFSQQPNSTVTYATIQSNASLVSNQTGFRLVLVP